MTRTRCAGERETNVTSTTSSNRTGRPDRSNRTGQPDRSNRTTHGRSDRPTGQAPASTDHTRGLRGLPGFADLGVPAAMVGKLERLGLHTPFPIQAAALPDAMAGRDVSGRAPTGSGKTLAFSLPIATRVGRGQPGRPRALVLVPTRELASQVRDTLVPLAEQRQRRVMTIYGGTSIRQDQQRLAKGVDIVVATPGRLADLIRRRDLTLADVDLVVLDEADRMADMGFLPEVKRLLDSTSVERQTLLFSATLDGDVDVLVKRYQRDPVRHEVHTPEEEAGEVRHVFLPAERPERRHLTARIVRDRGPSIVFTRTKHGADRLAKQLAQDGIRTAAIHGNRSQGQRERALAQFTSGQVTTLVATDIAARGIHVDDVAVVVHHDLPATDKDYVHRSGRTGRAGANGLVVSLVGVEQLGDLDAIQRSLAMPRGLHALETDVAELEHLSAPTPVVEHRPSGRSGTKAVNHGQRTRGAQRARASHGRDGDQRTGGGRNGGSRKRSGGSDGAGHGRGHGAPSGGARRRARRS
jgi:superfamily II DNA/RNA helicase